jgi:hypothetical protein
LNKLVNHPVEVPRNKIEAGLSVSYCGYSILITNLGFVIISPVNSASK